MSYYTVVEHNGEFFAVFRTESLQIRIAAVEADVRSLRESQAADKQVWSATATARRCIMRARSAPVAPDRCAALPCLARRGSYALLPAGSIAARAATRPHAVC